jgi:hypothetical protein
MNLRLPTAKEINPFDDLDGRAAEKNLLGKSVAQVVVMLESNPLYYVADFMWIGPRAFAFYFPSVVTVAEKYADADFINSVCGTLEIRLENKAIPSDARAGVHHFCKIVLQEYDRFCIEPEVYGDLKRRFLNLLPLLSSGESSNA